MDDHSRYSLGAVEALGELNLQRALDMFGNRLQKAGVQADILSWASGTTRSSLAGNIERGSDLRISKPVLIDDKSQFVLAGLLAAKMGQHLDGEICNALGCSREEMLDGYLGILNHLIDSANKQGLGLYAERLTRSKVKYFPHLKTEALKPQALDVSPAFKEKVGNEEPQMPLGRELRPFQGEELQKLTCNDKLVLKPRDFLTLKVAVPKSGPVAEFF